MHIFLVYKLCLKFAINHQTELFLNTDYIHLKYIKIELINNDKKIH